MLAHAFAWSKNMKNIWKSSVNQLLGVTPNCWPTNFFLHFSSCVLYEPLVNIIKKVLFHNFWMFFIIFDHVNVVQPCVRWSKYTTDNSPIFLLRFCIHIHCFLSFLSHHHRWWLPLPLYCLLSGSQMDPLIPNFIFEFFYLNWFTNAERTTWIIEMYKATIRTCS